jgi:hypothetical protein
MDLGSWEDHDTTCPRAKCVYDLIGEGKATLDHPAPMLDKGRVKVGAFSRHWPCLEQSEFESGDSRIAGVVIQPVGWAEASRDGVFAGLARPCDRCGSCRG